MNRLYDSFKTEKEFFKCFFIILFPIFHKLHWYVLNNLLWLKIYIFFLSNCLIVNLGYVINKLFKISSFVKFSDKLNISIKKSISHSSIKSFHQISLSVFQYSHPEDIYIYICNIYIVKCSHIKYVISS